MDIKSAFNVKQVIISLWVWFSSSYIHNSTQATQERDNIGNGYHLLSMWKIRFFLNEQLLRNLSKDFQALSS